MKKEVALGLLILLVVSMSTAFLSQFGNVHAVDTSVYVEPSSVSVSLGGRANLTVKVFNVTDMFVWQIMLHFNTSIVNVTDVVLPSGHVFDGRVFVPGGPVYDVDYVSYGLSLIGGGWSFTGSGVLCVITVEGLSLGNSTLEFDLLDTFILNSILDEVPLSKQDGFVSVTTGIHDVAVDDAKTVCGTNNEYEIHKTVVCQNYTTTFNVTVQNIGDFDEISIVVQASANGTQFDSTTITSLLINSNRTLSFLWNTTGWQKGNYTIKLDATIGADGNTANNDCELPWPIAVAMVGDINNDRKVDMKDIGSAARAFGSIPTSPNWNANADVNNDGKVDMKDIGTAAKYFGEADP